MIEANVDLYNIFHISLAVEWIIITFQFDAQSIVFYLDYFSNPELLLACLLQLSFIKCSNNFLTIEITNNICPWYSIFYFFHYENVRRKIWCIAYIFYFSFYHLIRNFEFNPFIIILNTILNIQTWTNIGRLYFHWFLIRVAVFVNYFI